jgi:hypothetical protein
VRIEGHPAKKLSFWIRRADFVRQYQKIDGFWLPQKDQTLAPGTAVWEESSDHRSPGLFRESRSEQGRAGNRSRSRHRFDFVALTHNTPAAGNTALARALSFCTEHATSVPAARPRGILFLMTIA